nr:hypothetical protein CFP56_43894 [Quercus suber]
MERRLCRPVPLPFEALKDSVVRYTSTSCPVPSWNSYCICIGLSVLVTLIMLSFFGWRGIVRSLNVGRQQVTVKHGDMFLFKYPYTLLPCLPAEDAFSSLSRPMLDRGGA